MSKQGTKRAQARAKKAVAKRAAMSQPGAKSKYAQRREARLRGAPMAAREHPPWHSKLSDGDRAHVARVAVPARPAAPGRSTTLVDPVTERQADYIRGE